jgi:predicted RecB family endonuclease
MVDNKSKDDNSVRTVDTQDIYDTVKNNFLRSIDEIVKVQPQYSQSISNLQLDYIQTIKNTIQTTISAQKQLIGGLNIQLAAPNTELFTKQSNEITNNAIRAVAINNELIINAFEAARENLKIYNRTVDSITEFNTNVGKAWTSLFSVQQQFFRH